MKNEVFITGLLSILEIHFRLETQFSLFLWVQALIMTCWSMDGRAYRYIQSVQKVIKQEK